MDNFDRGVFTALVAKNCEDKATREAIFELLDFADKKALDVKGGQDNKNFHYVVGIRGGSARLFSCDSFGNIEVCRIPFIKSQVYKSFANKLINLRPEFQYLSRLADGRSFEGFSIKNTLVDPKVMKTFKEEILRIQTSNS